MPGRSVPAQIRVPGVYILRCFPGKAGNKYTPRCPDVVKEVVGLRSRPPLVMYLLQFLERIHYQRWAVSPRTS
eukprot:8207473-Pyramimonas_sp.AAC.1